MERAFHGVWIPKDVWLMKELSVLDRCLYAEIDSLDNEEGCYASDKYFSGFFTVHVNTIRNSINKMIETGLIFKAGKRGKSRVLKIKSTTQTELDFNTDNNCEYKQQNLSITSPESNPDNNLKDMSPKPTASKPIPTPGQIIQEDKKPKKPFDEMTDYEKVIDTYYNCFIHATEGKMPMINGVTGKIVKDLLKQPLEQVLTVVKKYFEQEFWFTDNKQYDMRQIQFHYNEILSAKSTKKPESDWYLQNKPKIDARFAGGY